MSTEKMYYSLTSSRAFILYLVFTINVIYYVNTAGLNALQLVVVGTLMELAIFLFEVPTGLIADYFGRRRSVIIGFFIIGTAHILEGMIPEFWSIAIASILWGIGWTFISGAEQAWVADELNEESKLSKVFIHGAKYASFASFLGIIASVIFARILSVQYVIVLAGFLFLAVGLIAIIVMKESNFVMVSKREKNNTIFTSLKSSLEEIKSIQVLKWIALITFVIGLSSEGFDRLWGAHFIGQFQLDEDKSVYWFGLFFAIALLLNTILLNWIEKIDSKRFSIILLLLNSLLIFTLVIFATTPYFVIAVAMYWLIEGLRNINYPIMNIYINERVSSDSRATSLSLFGQLDAIGQIIGGILIGTIAQVTTISFGLVATAILIVPTILLIYFMKREELHV